jgi:hypothetical protein
MEVGSMTNDTIPQAPDSERAVLSVLLLNGSAAEARDKIKPAHFYTPSNRMIFEAILQLDARGIALDPVQLTEELRAAGKLEKIGGQAYISEVIGAGLRCDMPGHIDRVIETATKRKLWVDATRAAEAANNGHTSAQVVEMLRGAAEAADNSHISLNSQPVIERTPVQWPEPLGKAAYYGLAGEIVRAIDPHTEADVVAVLGQLLASFGNVVGRRAHFLAEADQHFTNSNIVLVGNTSKGRKGTSYGQVRRLLAAVDPEWAGRCVAGGMSSGEGLIWAVRDAIEKHEPIKVKGRIDGYQDVIVDQGVTDKRLLAIESEFASVLKVASREGNTLSAVIRQAWDNGNLCSLTKNSPARATGAHISIIGHITKDELRRYLEATETANGFANRFLWFCVRQSKMLPEGGQLHTVDFGPIERKLKTAIDHGREVEEMKRDDSARALWWDVYPKLSEGKAGLLGAVTSRAEAQVMRLACLYALLDCSATIRKPHLEAALELWRYAEDSARFIFGDAMGDPVADAILGALREAGDVGMTRTQISDLLKRHATRAAIDRALNSLAEAGRAKFRKEQTDGRPVERWFVFKAKCEISEKSELSPEDGDLSSLNSLFSQSAKFETGNPHGDLRHHPDFDREEVGE